MRQYQNQSYQEIIKNNLQDRMRTTSGKHDHPRQMNLSNIGQMQRHHTPPQEAPQSWHTIMIRIIPPKSDVDLMIHRKVNTRCRLYKQSAALPIYLLALRPLCNYHQRHHTAIRHHYLRTNTPKHGSSKPSTQPEAQARVTGTKSL